MAFKKGDFILINYTGKVKETGEIFDTTLEEQAKENKTYKEGEIYEPKLVVIGENWVLRSLDDHLLKSKINKKDSIEIPPEKAFGNRDPEKTKMVSLKRLTSRKITPKIGMQLDFDGKMATVRTIGSGRVQLDFNPPLAGKTIIYEFEVEQKLKTDSEKISALIHRRIPLVEPNKFKLKMGKTNIAVNMPEEAYFLDGIQIVKRGIAADLQRFFPKMTTVKFIEIFKKRKIEAK